MPDVAELLAELTRGTDDPDVVAEELRKRGVRGRRGSTCRCPVARALLDAGVKLVMVGTCWVHVDKSPVQLVETPDGIAAFLPRFDAGDYPDLEIGGD